MLPRLGILRPMKYRSGMVKFPRRLLRQGPLSAEAYASDASLYQVLPEAVVLPESAMEAAATVRQALASGKAVTPRGGGTGLAGGALGEGLIIDCSRLIEISHISIDNKYVICQPGIIYRDLNLALKKHGLFFPPDPSSGDSCQIGGMLANNSSGPRSVKYGLTSNYVEELTVVGKSGRPVLVRSLPLDSPELSEVFSDHPAYHEIFNLLSANKELILNRWPKVRKNSSGYNLHQVVSDLNRGRFNLPALYVGSEGTLGLFVSVWLRLLPLPQGLRSFRLFFDSLEDAGDAVGPLLNTAPAGLEIVDGATLNLIGRARYRIPAQAAAMLLLEYDDELDHREQALTALVPRLRLAAPIERAANEQEQNALWAARKAIVPTLYKHHPIKRPLPFIEDASLPVSTLHEFITWVRQRLEREGLVFGLFGHIGDGNLHIRPLMDINQDGDFTLMQTLYHEVYDKILELGGSTTAEHADGRLRASLVRRLYGDEIYGLFRRIKAILDPDNRFNPGVILSDQPFTENLDLKKLELVCAACGKCNGYCPAFEVFRREDMSPRGWLRMMHHGESDPKALERFYQYCLNCKSCTVVCPAGVDIAGEILSFKAKRPSRTAGRIISLFDRRRTFEKLLAIGSRAYPLSRTWGGRTAAAITGKLPFGFDHDVVLPRPARKSLRARYPELCRPTGIVALFHGCADNYFDFAAGDALVAVFRHFGWDLAFPTQDCCGLPMEVYGHKENLVAKARANIDALEPFEAVVFTCASCLHRLADYSELFAKDSPYHSKALALKNKLFDISQYLLSRNAALPKCGSSRPVRLSYHHPCHLRAAGREMEPLRLLARVDGIKILHPERAGRCCGQAGSYGFVHYSEGKAAFAAKKEEYRDLDPDIIVSSCPSCISKIRQEMGDGIRVCHPIEIIADLIAGKPLHDK